MVDRAEASLLWYKDMLDNGRQAVQYQALVQFVEVTQKGNWSEAFRAPCLYLGWKEQWICCVTRGREGREVRVG